MNVGGLSGTIFDWTMLITIIGCIVLIVYAILATISYLTLSSRIETNKAMDRMAKFTGQDAVVTNKGVLKVVGRLMVTILICTFLLSGGGFLLIRIIYQFIDVLYNGMMGYV